MLSTTSGLPFSTTENKCPCASSSLELHLVTILVTFRPALHSQTVRFFKRNLLNSVKIYLCGGGRLIRRSESLSTRWTALGLCDLPGLVRVSFSGYLWRGGTRYFAGRSVSYFSPKLYCRLGEAIYDPKHPKDGQEKFSGRLS